MTRARRALLVGGAAAAVGTLAAAGAWRASVSLGRARRENRAIERLLAVYRAQTRYYAIERGDGVRRYAPTLEELAAKAPAERGGHDLDVIAAASSATRALEGYWFALVEREGGPDWDGQSFAAVAVPAEYPRSGRRTFAIDQRGRLWAHETEGETPGPMPVEPTEAGWDELAAPGS